MEVEEYRNKILEILLNAKDDEGKARLTEKAAHDLAEEFSDQELLDGMGFNTPEEVAEMLLDSGLD
jgi:hypothetical protein